MADSEHRISTIEQLRELYRAPHPTVEKKVRSSIDEASARYIATCPFLVLATSDGAGSVDASPRGGPPGFVKVLDDRHVALPDLNGNNLLHSYNNIVAHPYVGLLLIVPGIDETLRINGPAQMTTDPDVLDGFVEELRRPKMAIVVETAELYSHCAKAFRRGQVWQPDAWATFSNAPDLAEILSCQRPEIDPVRLRADLEQGYTAGLALDRNEEPVSD